MEDEQFKLEFAIEDIHLLYYCVCEKIKNWEGYPARPIYEQEHLEHLKNDLYRFILDFKYREME